MYGCSEQSVDVTIDGLPQITVPPTHTVLDVVLSSHPLLDS